MTATKDELLWAVDRAFHHSKPGHGIDLLSIKKELDRIINLHLSISEEERKEAVEWIKKELSEWGVYIDKMPDLIEAKGFPRDYIKRLKVFLKALGEKVG